MKITKKEGGANLLPRAGADPDVYDVQLSHHTIALIDRDDYIVDVLPRCALRYTMQEAEALIDEIVKQWPDAREDKYYKQGPATFPVVSPRPEVYDDIDVYRWSRDITIYRYSFCGESVYGITNRFDPDVEITRYVEASLDGWELWLRDHKRALEQKHEIGM